MVREFTVVDLVAECLRAATRTANDKSKMAPLIALIESLQGESQTERAMIQFCPDSKELFNLDRSRDAS